MPGSFADEQLAAFAAQPSPPFAQLEVARDESEAYACRLRDAGVEVELRREAGLIHNFMLLDEISPACAAAANRVAADLRVHLNAP